MVIKALLYKEVTSIIGFLAFFFVQESLLLVKVWCWNQMENLFDCETIGDVEQKPFKTGLIGRFLRLFEAAAIIKNDF